LAEDVKWYYHPACSKTQPMRTLLTELAGADVPAQDLTTQMLTAAEIIDIAQHLNLTVRDLIRPASPVFRERQDELYAMPESELAALMATEPTLVKRPIVRTARGVVVGLDEAAVRQLLNR